MDFSGGVRVRNGVLKMNLGQHYTWFRFIVKNVYNANQNRVYLGHMAFFDELGNDLSFGTTYDATVRSDHMALKPWICTLGTNQTPATSYPLDNLFNTYVDGQYARWSYSPATLFNVEDEGTWLTLVVRLPADAGVAVKYDMISAANQSNKPALSTPCNWELYGSADGENWALIDSQTEFKKYRANENYWLSDQSAYSNASPAGFPFSSTNAAASVHVKMASVSSVQVASGAKLVSDAVVPVDSVVYDADEGAGTIDGFSFPASGTLELKGCGARLLGAVSIPMRFTNCTDVANISGWNLAMGGACLRAGSYRISATASGIEAVPVQAGFALIVR